MLLSEISYMIMEQLRSYRLVDDEEMDIRLINDWVKMKRADILKNKANSGCKLNLNNMQTIEITVSRNATNSTAQNVYPFTTLTEQDYFFYKSTTKIPTILWTSSGPLIYEIASSDGMKLPYSFGSHSRLRFTGNGRFNTNLIFAAIDADRYLYMSDNTYLTADSKVLLKAVFEDPTDIPTFNIATDEFPCSLDVMEAIKLSVFDKDFRVALNSKEDINANDADDQN